MHEVIGDFTVEVEQDTDAEDPRAWMDHLGTMACFHSRYTLGDKDHGYRSSDYNSWAEMKKAITKQEDALVILPIYMYDHSGITISTTPFSCPWDSGQIGFIFVSKSKVRKEYNKKLISKQLKEKVTQYLIGEVKEYDQYLTGDVYGYIITDNDTQGAESCWGFYGYNECVEEAKSLTHYMQTKKNEEKELLKQSVVINNELVKELGARI